MSLSQIFPDIYVTKGDGGENFPAECDFLKMSDNNRMTITEVAETVGVVPKTIIRWEKSGKIKRAKRDWRGWRVYTRADLEELNIFHDSIY